MFNRMKTYIKRQYYTEVEGDANADAGFNIKKLLKYFLTKPFDIWRDLMIPISEEGVWRRNYAACAPIVGYFTCLAYTEGKVFILTRFRS